MKFKMYDTLGRVDIDGVRSVLIKRAEYPLFCGMYFLGNSESSEEDWIQIKPTASPGCERPIEADAPLAFYLERLEDQIAKYGMYTLCPWCATGKLESGLEDAKKIVKNTEKCIKHLKDML